MITFLTICIALILVLNIAVAIAVISRGKNKSDDAGTLELNKLVLQQMNELSRAVDSKMSETGKRMTDSLIESKNDTRKQFGESQELVSRFIKEITVMTDKVARVEETGKQMVSFADQLQSLQDILKNPKQRGILGEYYLETLLKNVMPPGSYQMQYPFADNTIVDAVVFVKDKIIPIDSKFSLENYNRLSEEKDPAERERLETAFRNDLKKRIDETSKYVKPNENTMDFAFMFIPHEAIYYDLLVARVGAVKVNTRDLIEYAFKEKHVIIVSPTSFLAYLQTVLQGLKALQIEESAKEIRAKVEDLQKHLKGYEDYHSKLGNALGTAVNQFNFSTKQFKMIDKDVTKITGASVGIMEAGIDAVLLDKPGEVGEE